MLSEEECTWLLTNGLWSEAMTDFDANLRCKNFMGMEFPTATKQEWPWLIKDLLPFEEWLVVKGGMLGYVSEYPFSFEVNDMTPIRQKPLPYTKVQKQWIQNYGDQQEKLGVV